MKHHRWQFICMLCVVLLPLFGCNPLPSVENITKEVASFGMLAQGQEFTLLRDALTDGRVLITRIGLPKDGQVDWIEVDAFKDSPSVYPNFTVVPSGVIMRVDAIHWEHMVTNSVLRADMLMRTGDYAGRILEVRSGADRWFVGAMATRDLRVNPAWLQSTQR